MSNPPAIAELADKRDDLDVTQATVAKHLADAGCFDVAASTLSGRLSKWERGDTDASADAREALAEALDTIAAEQNHSYPDCAQCGYTPELEVEWADGDPYCIVCYEGGKVPGVDRIERGDME